MKVVSFFGKYVLFICVVVFISGCIYGSEQNENVIDISSESGIATSSVSVADVSSEKTQRIKNYNCTMINTLDWKTYENEKFGFQFDYPNNVEIEEFSGASTSMRIDITDSDCPTTHFSLNVFPIDYLKEWPPIGDGFLLRTEKQLIDMKNREDAILIHGIPTVSYITYVPSGGSFAQVAYFIFDDRYIVLSNELIIPFSDTFASKREEVTSIHNDIENGNVDERVLSDMEMFNLMKDSVSSMQEKEKNTNINITKFDLESGVGETQSRSRAAFMAMSQSLRDSLIGKNDFQKVDILVDSMNGTRAILLAGRTQTQASKFLNVDERILKLKKMVEINPDISEYIESTILGSLPDDFNNIERWSEEEYAIATKIYSLMRIGKKETVYLLFQEKIDECQITHLGSYIDIALSNYRYSKPYKGMCNY